MFNSFIKPVCKVTKKIDNLAAIFQALQGLERDDILVGIPQEKNSRTDEAPNNAELGYVLAHGVQPQDETVTALDGYLMERGDPLWQIPPRPFLEPAIKANLDRIAAQQTKVIRAALAGENEKARVEIVKLGLLGQNIIKAWFVDPRNNWAPNAASTIARKKSDRPMIDTGALRNSITYVVRAK